jgi:hypothetical protein
MAETYAMLQVFFIAECDSCVTLMQKNYAVYNFSNSVTGLTWNKANLFHHVPLRLCDLLILYKDLF